VLLYFLLEKVICYCNFVTCNSLLPNTAKISGEFVPYRHVDIDNMWGTAVIFTSWRISGCWRW